MKKIVFLMFALFMTVTANAQFEADKVYVGASLSGIDLHYNGNDKLNLGVDGMVGYLPMDNLMLLGSASFKHNGDDDVPDEYKIGAVAATTLLRMVSTSVPTPSLFMPATTIMISCLVWK